MSYLPWNKESLARMLIGTAVVVPAWVIHGIETTDGVITVAGIEISLELVRACPDELASLPREETRKPPPTAWRQ